MITSVIIHTNGLNTLIRSSKFETSLSRSWLNYPKIGEDEYGGSKRRNKHGNLVKA